MKSDTPGMIIDHHALQKPMEAGWTFWGGDTGATTTLLVEQIRERKIAVTPVEATLLLLGIHEDTGSMVYATTTPRDILAAGWLLERGANLQVLARFLHHPLTPAQKELYAKLAENSETVSIAGHSIVIAPAVAPDYQDEISTLAHALRDIYDPAGLFLLVDLGDRIQLVARSTTDAIDVGAIAKEMGGGGHPRAAAALIRNQTLPEVSARLQDLLRATIKPSLTVGQIMTHGTPITVPPDTTIGDMAEVIQRYGFEGYPVVDNADTRRTAARPIQADQLRGLISRRQVDRGTIPWTGEPHGRPLHAHRLRHSQPRSKRQRAAAGDDRVRLGADPGGRSGKRPDRRHRHPNRSDQTVGSADPGIAPRGHRAAHGFGVAYRLADPVAPGRCNRRGACNFRCMP